MEKLYKLNEDKHNEKGEGGKRYFSKTISDAEDKPPPKPCPVVYHTDMIPPTEIMALGMYRYAHN